MLKVWNYQQEDFPREGLNPLQPAQDCQFTMRLRLEAAKLARINQLDLPDPAELPRFQKDLRAKLWKNFGAVYDPLLPLDITSYGKERGDGFTVEKIIYQSRPGLYVTALIYVPDGAGPFPAVVNMHGHNLDGKLAERVQTISQTIVKSGYVCISPDAFGVYERAVHYGQLEYHGGFLGSALLNVGETLMGAQVVDNMKAVDVLLSRPDVIPNKIGATGGSGGGNQTMWLATMDERIAAAMPVVSVGSFESYVTGVNCVCEMLPDGLTFTEETGILALIAPRPLKMGNALYDVNATFAVTEMLKTYRPVEKLYRQLGVPDNLAYTAVPRPHGMHREQREAMLGWFALHLKGEGHGAPLPEPEARPFPAEQLRMFATPAERPEKVRSTAEHCRLTGQKLLAALKTMQSLNANEKRRELAHCLRLQPLPPELAVKRYRQADGWEPCCIMADNRLIPILVKRGATPEFTILAHPEGKDHIDPKRIADLENQGQGILLLDLSGTGETANPNPVVGLHHQFFRQLMWIGRTLLGEWCYDLLCALKLLRTSYQAKSIRLFGEREAGLAALLAGALDGDAFVTTLDSPATLLFKTDEEKSFAQTASASHQTFYSLMMAVPGFLQWGDVSLAAALTGHPVTAISPRYLDGTPAPEDRYCWPLKE